MIIHQDNLSLKFKLANQALQIISTPQCNFEYG